jgi:hypothetical protein
MSGDLSVAASGTVTYRDGNRVYGFGHPMFQFGTTDIPMSKAEVLLTLSSSMASSKLTQATEIVGAIKQDRLTAIVGQLGAKARMIPVTVDVHTARGESKTYNFEMFEDPTFTPMLLNLAVANTIVGSSDNELVQTVSLKGRFEMENHAPVEVAQIAMSSDESELFLPVAMRVSGQLTRIFSTLYNNQLERPLIKKIGIQVEQAAERRGTIIEEIRADREEVRPGEEFSLAVTLRPYRNERVTRIVTLKAPETAERDQDLRVTVSDAASLDAAESRSGSPSGPATSLRELIARLNRARSASSIYVKLSQNTPGAIVNQQTLPSLPRSVLSVMRSNQTAATTVATSDSTLMITAEPVGYPVSGSKAITLRVR